MSDRTTLLGTLQEATGNGNGSTPRPIRRKAPAPPEPKKPRKVKTPRRAPSGLAMAVPLFALAGAMLCVSMPHLSVGVQRITACSTLTAWLMALILDTSQVAAEAAHLRLARHKLGDRERLFCRGIIFSCTTLSAWLNIEAFLEHANGVIGCVQATLFGLVLPLGVLVFSYLGSRFISQPR
jgi:hypothetical protein